LIPDKTCYLYSKTGELAHSFVDIESKSYTARFSPNSSLLAIGCDDGSTYLYDIKSQKSKKIAVKEKGKVRSLCFSNDNSLVAIGQNDEEVGSWVSVWDVNLGKCLDSFQANDLLCTSQTSLFFTHDNTGLVCNFNIRGTNPKENRIIIRDVNAQAFVFSLLKQKRLLLEGYNSDYSLISGFDDAAKFAAIWEIDKKLEHYLCKDITIDQSLLLGLVFKAMHTKLILTVPGDSKLKVTYDSIANENLKKLITPYIKFDNDESKNRPQRKRKR
jgi:WD40 repeat protein